MAARNRKKRLSMRKIREILRLGFAGGIGTREIARSCAVAPSTVLDYLHRARRSGLEAPPDHLDDTNLEKLLFPERATPDGSQRPQPDLNRVHRELRKKSVTLQLLWEEYKEIHPDGYQITQFYELYRRFRLSIPALVDMTVLEIVKREYSRCSLQDQSITQANRGTWMSRDAPARPDPQLR
jgi:transposase